MLRPMQDMVRYIMVPALVGGLVGLLVIVFAPGEKTPSSAGYAQAVARAAPSVVNIYSTLVTTPRTLPPVCQDRRFSRLCGPQSGYSERMQSSLGSGVIVSADGYILTNLHVIENAEQILVAFANGQATTAERVGHDMATDLAVIKVRATGLPVITSGAANTLAVGDIALAIGNPFGIGQTVSQGIISATSRAQVSETAYDDLIQTDAAINPGNSGGALINAEGELIGINTLIYSRQNGSEGIGFAIPVQLALDVMRELVVNGKVTRGWLGVTLTSVPVFGESGGLEVTHVVPWGPAGQAGLRRGDLILACNERPATNTRLVGQEIAGTLPGNIITLDVLRGDQRFALQITADERPETRGIATRETNR